MRAQLTPGPTTRVKVRWDIYDTCKLAPGPDFTTCLHVRSGRPEGQVRGSPPANLTAEHLLALSATLAKALGDEARFLSPSGLLAS